MHVYQHSALTFTILWKVNEARTPSATASARFFSMGPGGSGPGVMLPRLHCSSGSWPCRKCMSAIYRQELSINVFLPSCSHDHSSRIPHDKIADSQKRLVHRISHTVVWPRFQRASGADDISLDSYSMLVQRMTMPETHMEASKPSWKKTHLRFTCGSSPFS